MQPERNWSATLVCKLERNPEKGAGAQMEHKIENADGAQLERKHWFVIWSATPKISRSATVKSLVCKLERKLERKSNSAGAQLEQNSGLKIGARLERNSKNAAGAQMKLKCGL